MREMEVLYDQLVSLFEADPELPAHEVVVMTPDVEAYAPLISAVFGAPTGGRTPIPYRIADRSARTTHEVFEALARLLDLLPGRMTAPQVLDLLATDIVRSRFGITATVP